MMPGNPTPTAERDLPPSRDNINSAILAAILSAGMERSASRESPTSGNTLTVPATWLFSTSAAAICSTTRTPAFLPMIFAPALHLGQLVQAVERRGFITLRKRRIVEDGVHE